MAIPAVHDPTIDQDDVARMASCSEFSGNASEPSACRMIVHSVELLGYPRLAVALDATPPRQVSWCAYQDGRKCW
jgi:hypothetical protein